MRSSTLKSSRIRKQEKNTVFVSLFFLQTTYHFRWEFWTSHDGHFQWLLSASVCKYFFLTSPTNQISIQHSELYFRRGCIFSFGRPFLTHTLINKREKYFWLSTFIFPFSYFTSSSLFSTLLMCMPLVSSNQFRSTQTESCAWQVATTHSY